MIVSTLEHVVPGNPNLCSWVMVTGHLRLAQRAVFCTDNSLEFSRETETVALMQGLHPALWSHDEQSLRILVGAVCGMEHPSEKENRIGQTAQPGPHSPGRLHDSGTNERETVCGDIGQCWDFRQ